MQYDATTPEAYLSSLEVDWRKDKLQQLRLLVMKQDEKIVESINYKMLCYSLNNKVIFHLNAQKGYVSLYCGNTQKIDPKGELLAGLNIGKGCIRFTKTKDIAQTGISTFVEQAVILARQGADLSC